MSTISDITIIIPVYCKSQESLAWLDECFTSAEEQGCTVLAIDDKSPFSPQIVFDKHKTRVTSLYAKEHHGVSYTRNMLTSRVDTELFLPLDCDDRLKPDTVKKMVMIWNRFQQPIYPDVMKFGTVNEEHYELLNFSCEMLLKYIGIAPVTVLQSKAMWEKIGGWDKEFDFYEDGEYNLRLFSEFCAQRIPEPLLEYRHHDTQRTVLYKDKAREYENKIKKLIGGLTMACPGCGGRRRSPSNFGAVPQSAQNKKTGGQMFQMPSPGGDAVNMPEFFEGKELARYEGNKGAGSHYYNGPVTHKPYKVRYGSIIYVDPHDLTPTSLLKKVTIAAPVIAQRAVQVIAPKGIESQEAGMGSDRQAVITVKRSAVVEEHKDLPDIENMSVRDIYALDMSEISGTDMAHLIELEETTKNRGKVLNFLRTGAKQ